MSKRKREWPPVSLELPVPVTDNHTHLPLHEGQIPSPGGVRLTLEEQLRRAKAAGVPHMITSGCELPEWDPVLRLCREHPQARAALAVHPNDAALHAGHLEKSPDGYEHSQEDYHIPLVEALGALADRLTDQMVVAVGETGLDYFRTAEPGREAQKESFRAHLEMARSFDLPLQIHDREAHADTIKLVSDPAWAEVTIVFHSFSGDREMAEILADHGWYASFSGPVTYPANAELRAALRSMPRELVMAETDAPYLTPAPYRGSPNASYVMPHTVAQIAELWELPLAQTCAQLSQNTNRVYGSW